MGLLSAVPRSIVPLKPLLMLSHMRANTSLLGHILGSNPEINGYYEMHIGYYSWKSLIRQRLLYFADHKRKIGGQYLFDKVLHNDHMVTAEVMNRADTRLIFALRAPQETIASIVKLYSGIDAEHDCASVAGALDYYCTRLQELRRLASDTQSGFFYFDAEILRDNSQALLANLSDWLELDVQLTPQYSKMKRTGEPRSGDSSGNISAGKILARAASEPLLELDASLLATAEAEYSSSRKILAANAQRAEFNH